MKESYWGYWLVMLGILVIGVMLLISSTTTGTTHDYYELKETASAAMVDAVDYSYYRLYNDIRISKEKFIENFIRRFSESASMTKKYAIGFYDIHEVPPKVSIKISSVSNSVNIANTANNSFDLVNRIDMILVAPSGTENKNLDTPSGDLKMCAILDFKKELGNVFQKVLTNQTIGTIPSDIVNRIKSKRNSLTHLNKWVDANKSIDDYDYFLEFQVAFYYDFIKSMGNLTTTLDQIIENDLTRGSNGETGIIEYAYEQHWISYDANFNKEYYYKDKQ